MSYEIRNSILLLIILIIFILGGYFSLQLRYGSEMDRLKKDRVVRETELNELNALADNVDYLYEHNREIDYKLNNFPKTLLPQQTINQSYRYLERLDQGNTFNNLNFKLIGEEKQTDISKVSYSLIGEGEFSEVLKLIKRIEFGKPLYKIESIKLFKLSDKQMQEIQLERQRTNQPAPRSWWVSVNMTLSGIFFAEGGVTPASYVESFDSDVNMSDLGYDMFDPLILEVLPPNTQNLVEVDKSRLISISGNTAIIQDQRGSVRQLKKGDSVYLGKLTDINISQGRVSFELNLGGISNTFVLELASNREG